MLRSWRGSAFPVSEDAGSPDGKIEGKRGTEDEGVGDDPFPDLASELDAVGQVGIESRQDRQEVDLPHQEPEQQPVANQHPASGAELELSLIHISEPTRPY